MAPSLWSHAPIVLDRWRFIGETEVFQALSNIRSPFLLSRFLIGIMQIYSLSISSGRIKRGRGEKGVKKGCLQSHLDNKYDDNPLADASQTQQVISETYTFICQAPAISLLSRLSGAYSNTGFDTNSCHLVQFTGKGRMMCIIRMAKKMGERRCFKVPEFDSSERLLVTSVPLCVGTFVCV